MSYDVTYRVRRLLLMFEGPIDSFGEQALFYGETMRFIPNALTRYRKETTRLVAEMTLGAGALIMIGGTVGVAAFLTLASGGVIAVQGGPKGVGTAVNETVVYAFICLFVINVVMTAIGVKLSAK